ncbi:MAG: carboxypeptidase-like regulatory domain-containing protein [Bacteroidales bacterium]|nr:carboxypeptidase-like regulatory domain-containing protein [Bacteroidales bacterium]
MKRLLSIAVLSLLVIPAISQEISPLRYVQVNGLVFDNENMPVKYVNIISRGLRTGTNTDDRGIFSIISYPGDTLIFSSIGYQPAFVRIPPDVESPVYTIDITMYIDTINIGSVLVLPWKTYEDFKRAVVEYISPMEVEITNMENNLALVERQILEDLDITPEAGYRYAMQQEAERIMTRNQTPVNNLFNPFAWAKFIDGLKNGLLKNKKSKKKQDEDNKTDRN